MENHRTFFSGTAGAAKEQEGSQASELYRLQKPCNTVYPDIGGSFPDRKHEENERKPKPGCLYQERQHIY